MRFLSAVLRNGVIWMTSGDGCVPAGASSSNPQACIRVDAVNISGFPTATLQQDYDIAELMSGPGTPEAGDLFFPAITLDPTGVVYLAFSSVTPSTAPGFSVADILPATQNQVDQVVQIAGG